jgi:hypothetical protein
MNMNQPIDLKNLFERLKIRIQQEAQKRKPKNTADPDHYGFESEEPEESTTSVPNSQKSGTHWLIQFLRFCLLIGVGCLAFANIKPYINIVNWLGSGLADNKILSVIGNIPLIGYLFTTGAIATTFVLGCLLWMLLQGQQMLPKLVLNDPEALLVLMSWVVRFKSIAFKSTDTPMLRQLKQRFNNIPLEWIERMQNARAISYVIDAILCFGYYPPIVGGYDRLGIVLVSPSLNDIAWFNVIAALATMFGIEILYEVWKMLSIALDILNEAMAQRTEVI